MGEVVTNKILKEKLKTFIMESAQEYCDMNWDELKTAHEKLLQQWDNRRFFEHDNMRWDYMWKRYGIYYIDVWLHESKSWRVSKRLERRRQIKILTI